MLTAFLNISIHIKFMTFRATTGRSNRPVRPVVYGFDRKKPITDRRIAKKDIAGLEGLPNNARPLLLRLMEGQMTQKEVYEIIDDDIKIKDFCVIVNKWTRERYGQDGVIKESLRGKKQPKGFWTIRLDDKIFEAEKEKVNWKDQISLGDVVTAKTRKIIAHIAEKGWVTKGELNALGVREMHNINKQSVEKGLPPVLIATKTWPKLYRVNPKFARMFRIRTNSRIEPEKMFSRSDLDFIKYLANNGNVRLMDILKKDGTEYYNVAYVWIARINRRCRELGLPEAIEKCGTGNLRMVRMTQKFCECTGIKNKKSRSLKSYFSDVQIAVIEEIRTHPFTRSSEIGARLGLVSHGIEEHLRNIKKICEENNLPPLIKIGKCRSRYRLSREFHERFDLKEIRINPVNCLAGRKQVRIFEYFKKHPNKTRVQAARALRMNRDVLTAQISDMNGIFKKAGIPRLEPATRSLPRMTSPYTAYAA